MDVFKMKKMVKKRIKKRKSVKIVKKMNVRKPDLRISYADIISFINVFLGFSAIILLFRLGDFVIPSVLLIIAAVLDFFDGKVARKFNQANEFGKNIDSLSDVISFGVAPAIFMQQFLSWPMIFIPFIIILAGIYRLARYNVINEKHFTGMPITFNGLVIPIIYLAGLMSGITAIVLSIVLAVLMVCRFKVKKYL